MWFKQVQLFQLLESAPTYKAEDLQQKLEPLRFTSCLPSLFFSAGWVAPFAEEEALLVQAVPGYLLICLQIEEKILPAAVVRQALDEKI